MRGQHQAIQDYYDTKNNKEYIVSKALPNQKNIIGIRKVTKEQRAIFENKQRFTLGNSKIPGALKLHEFYFNYMYRQFKTEIKKRYSIGKMSVKTLHKEVIDNDKNKTMNVRILAYIKVFKSLKRAQENGAFSKRTLQRYEKYMSEKNLSTTKVNSNIYQCWNHQNYYSHLRKHLITPFKLTKELKKFRFDF